MTARPMQILLIVSTLAGSWLGMQIVHESGHVLGAWATDGHVVRVVLSPLVISRTDVQPNPSPLVETWAGPVWGMVFPLILWVVCWKLKIPGAFVCRFFAGFCLVANGCYLSFGSIDRVGDPGVLMQYGTPAWALWLFGAITIPLGLGIWHGQGHHFGFAESKGQVDRPVAWVCFAAVMAIILLELSMNHF